MTGRRSSTSSTDAAVDAVPVGVAESDRLRADEQLPAAPAAASAHRSLAQRNDPTAVSTGRSRRCSAPSAPGNQVVLAEEAGDELVGRPVVDLLRRADLLDAAGVHHADAVGHGDRLLLVVGDEQEGGAISRCSCLRKRCICRRSSASSAPSGSSSRISRGSQMMARASATRWRWPPLSCAG